MLAWPGEEEKRIPGKPLASISKLQSTNKNPQLIREAGKLTRSWAALIFAAQMNGWSGSLNGPISGVRTYGEQKDLHKKFVLGLGPPAFHPDGPSKHILKNINREGQWSQAVDVSRPGELIRVARTLGVDLYRPYDDEPWHIEAKRPFALSGFFPGTGKTIPATRTAISSLELLGLLGALALFFLLAFAFEAKRNEERVLLVFSQILLFPSAILLLYNVAALNNTVAFAALLLSALALALLLLIPFRR